MWQLNSNDKELIDIALKEDLNFPYYDATTTIFFPNNIQKRSVYIISKDKYDVVVCGITAVKYILEKFGVFTGLEVYVDDKKIIKKGEKLLKISAPADILLKTERLILNFLRHLSAISTYTKKFVDSVKNTNLKILDTRKTTPGMRHLEKYAVLCGGGINHRMGLYDEIMLKDTHLGMLPDLCSALKMLPELKNSSLPVVIEIHNIADLKTAITYGKNKITRILLDNMSVVDLTKCVLLCRDIFVTEASGNITLENISKIAETGVDYASIGALTYAAPPVDFSMQAI